MNKLTLGISPHIRSGNTTQRIMLDVIIALIPALIAGVINYGFYSLVLTLVSVAACVLCEFLFTKIHKQETTIGDLSAIVTGILIAFNVSPSLPVWQLIIGDIAAIVVAKMLFGGLGRNFINPALIGRTVIMFCFTSNLSTYVFPENGIDVLSSATPLAVIDKLDMSSFTTLFLGNHGGMIGETCALALLIGLIYLLVRRVIKPITPLVFVAATFLFVFLFNGLNATQAFLGLFSGGLFLGAFFMATDYVTTPTTDMGKVIFGLGCALITAAIRVFGNYPEGVSFSIMLMNLIVPFINIKIRKPFGEVKAK